MPSLKKNIFTLSFSLAKTRAREAELIGLKPFLSRNSFKTNDLLTVAILAKNNLFVNNRNFRAILSEQLALQR